MWGSLCSPEALAGPSFSTPGRGPTAAAAVGGASATGALGGSQIRTHTGETTPAQSVAIFSSLLLSHGYLHSDERPFLSPEHWEKLQEEVNPASPPVNPLGAHGEVKGHLGGSLRFLTDP